MPKPFKLFTGPFAALRNAIPRRLPQDFEEVAYLEANLDVKAAVARGDVASSAAHWKSYWLSEKRVLRVPEGWDETTYLLLNPDVQLGSISGYVRSGHEHWVSFGREEGRICPPVQFPAWGEKLLAEMAELELDLAYSVKKRMGFREFVQEMESETGKTFASLCRRYPPPYTHMFALPWIKRGGADLEAIYLINAVAARAHTRVLVVTTDQEDNPWRDRLVDTVDFLPLASIVEELPAIERLPFFVRFVIQLAPGIFHNVNSSLAWNATVEFGPELAEHTELWASVFCYDYSVDGEPVGYARLLSQCGHLFSGLMTDSTYFRDEVVERYGVDRHRVFPIRQPLPGIEMVSPAVCERDPASRTVLWASRLDGQKRPDLLEAVARRMPDVTFEMHGGTLLEKSVIVEALKCLPNVDYRGPYETFNALKTQHHAAFFYPSHWDGLANILLEVGARGVPIVASDVGGASELIGPREGWLIAPFDDVEAYVAALRKVIDNPMEARLRSRSLLRKMQDERTEAAYLDQLERIRRYLDAGPVTRAIEGQSAVPGR